MPGADESARGAPEPFSVPIDAVQPSQLYLDGLKLSLVTQWFDFADPNYEPLPVREVETGEGEEERKREGEEESVEDEWMLTDGHTRAFVAYLAGADELRIVRDTDDLPMDVYRECVGWCEEAGVTTIADLAGRVLDHDEFEEKWIARCQAVTEE